MNILVFGATGPTGLQVLKLALEQNDRVTAFARNPAALTFTHPNLTVTKGDITHSSSIDAAMADQEAVISTLGVRKITRNTILSDGTRNILVSMQKHNVRRFICETSIGVGDSRGQMIWIFEKLVRTTFLKAAFDDKEVQEKIIKASPLDWIILRPAMLTNGPITSVYRCWIGPRPENIKLKISRADVADFALKNLAETPYLRHAVNLSY